MATKRMLIDAAHPEEIRVAVMDGNQLEELDVESAARRQLKGNIYLAKVTRVEPSLQAAFVDYGGNRHGFLAFSEIHPDYYQIPIADREELLAEESAASESDDDDIDDESSEDVNGQETNGKSVETVGGDVIDEVGTRRNFFPAKRYKIQEVIKRRQILLVQVVKEERGNKGAALTTYMSLAGRYCVLMPNTGKGGGISRKIASGSDRKRLKTIIADFEIPDGMAVIVRTAGADRSKAEIKRDYEYLIKLWSGVRDLTLESTAPAMIHEEASIIKRAVRDHYSRDIDEVIVEGDDGYRTAKDLMKMLIPSHAKKVQPYKDTTVPLFNRFHIESQLETMNSPNVQLKSGGYIVINITEALVAVD
ncbi:MAG: ribonuclease E/G, partial [Rhodospirillaceae bacterium]|nr:ribonuclease E/G [Rhodospirillaceae bacterium]